MTIKERELMLMLAKLITAKLDADDDWEYFVILKLVNEIEQEAAEP